MNPAFQICDLDPRDRPGLRQTAALLRAGFADPAPSPWPTQAEALAEVRASFKDGGISRVARAGGAVVGWVAARPTYAGHVWELHPLVVHPDYQGQGIGRALVVDLEMQVSARGGLTIFLGTDDEHRRTSLGGRELYPDVLGQLAALRCLHHHPVGFYQKLGFSVVGVLPDANGPGKPDIFMAKRVPGALPPGEE